MIWLLLSILSSTAIFVVFKLFDRYGINNLQAIVVNYFVAYLVGYLIFDFDFDPAAIVEKPWFTSTLLIGFIFISLFQVMAATAQTLGVSAVSVAVKMSLVIPVIFAVIYYDEGLGWLKIIGTLCALLAVVLATRKKEKTSKNLKLLYLPIILFLGSGFLDVLLKYNQAELVPMHEQGFFTSQLFLVAGTIGVVWAAIPMITGQHKFQWKNVWGGIALGIPNYGSIYFLLRTLDIQSLEASVIFPINNVGIVAFSVIVGKLLFQEKISLLNFIGIVLALLAIAFMAAANYY